MNNSKFTMNALMVIVLVFSAIMMLLTVRIYDVAEHAYLITDYEPIEGTDLSIRYSTKEISGIYRGSKYDDELVLEGSFGYDLGTTVSGSRLYLNEYSYSDLDLVYCDAVVVDTQTFEKKVLMKNAMLRGRCASGELVCRGDCLMQLNAPYTNSLCRLYSMTDPVIDPSSKRAAVLFIDPASGEVVYSTVDEDGLSGDFDERWLSRTLEEVRQ